MTPINKWTLFGEVSKPGHTHTPHTTRAGITTSVPTQEEAEPEE